jgi:mRNA interferase HigB
MNVISRGLLRKHWEMPGRRDSEKQLKIWFEVTKSADWNSHDDVKRAFGAKIDLAHGKYVYNVRGNKYRLIFDIDFTRRSVVVLQVTTHAEYDKLCKHNGRGLKDL